MTEKFWYVCSERYQCGQDSVAFSCLADEAQAFWARLAEEAPSLNHSRKTPVVAAQLKDAMD